MDVKLAYPGNNQEERPLGDFSIFLPTLTTYPIQKTEEEIHGGIAVIGRNGSGKSLLGKAVLAAAPDNKSNSGDDQKNPFVAQGNLTVTKDKPQTSLLNRENRHLLGRAGQPVSRPTLSVTVAHVSFDSHKDLLEETDEKTGEPLSAFKTIALKGNAPGRLNAAARFLVVRFGLYPLMHRPVTTLSTGEIRKVLLVRALSQKPKLLLLDNAFDGLDVPSRKVLQDIISKTLKGFSNDLLVQGVSSKDTADKTQVVLMTHRSEELDEIPELDTVAWWGKENTADDQSQSLHSWNVRRRHNFGRVNGKHGETENDGDARNTWTSGTEVLRRAMGWDASPNNDESSSNAVSYEKSSLPSRDAVEDWWNYGAYTNKDDGDDTDALVEAADLTVQKGTAVLLKNLSWTVRKGERWIVGGGNGAGKSTLSRLLALTPPTSMATTTESLRILSHCSPEDPRTVVGWVSTESHMLQQQKQQQQQQHSSDELQANEPTTREFLERESRNASWEHTIRPVLDWLGIPNTSQCLDRPFRALSQGEQKLIMVAAAVALRPPLLVLDEPCQGLDLRNRHTLLQAIEGICRATDIALIYITHHLDEERVPSISHALHLKDRRAVYRGSIEEYAPEQYIDDDDDADS